jgi:hypothetical protein
MTTINAVVEIDRSKGVLYVHLTNPADIEALGVCTLIRLSNTGPMGQGKQFDIRLEEKVNKPLHELAVERAIADLFSNVVLRSGNKLTFVKGLQPSDIVLPYAWLGTEICVDMVSDYIKEAEKEGVSFKQLFPELPGWWDQP